MGEMILRISYRNPNARDQICDTVKTDADDNIAEHLLASKQYGKPESRPLFVLDMPFFPFCLLDEPKQDRQSIMRAKSISFPHFYRA